MKSDVSNIIKYILNSSLIAESTLVNQHLSFKFNDHPIWSRLNNRNKNILDISIRYGLSN